VKIDRKVEVLEWPMVNEMGGAKRATVLLPQPIPAGVKLPVLVALHGLGETIDPMTGARAWPKSYALEAAYNRMLDPPLHPEDLQGLVTSERLTEINDSLAKRELGGVIVVCPYLPKDIGGGTPMELYAKWIGDRLLPRVRSELPALDTTAATGIDGVSLGGWSALRIGMLRPDLFGAVGALQPAVNDLAQVDWAVQLLSQGLKGRPFRFITSTEDMYRLTLTELDKRLTAKGIAHEFAITPGPHDYPWNKGPGAVEMLLWHDRVLRG
jgi:enterochelin esterase-like enzyme